MGHGEAGKKALRVMPRLTDDQRRLAQGNAAFERAWKDIADHMKRAPYATEAEPGKLDELKDLLEEMKIVDKEKLLAKNAEDPRALEIMAPYVPPYAYGVAEALAPSQSASAPSNVAAAGAPKLEPKKEPTGSEIAQGAKKPGEFKFKPVVDEWPLNLFIQTMRADGAIKVQIAWMQVSRGNPMVTENAYTVALDGSQAAKASAKKLLERILAADTRLVVMRTNPAFEDLRDVYNLVKDDGLFWKSFKPTELCLLAGAFNPRAKELGADLGLDHLCQMTNTKRELVAGLYPKAPDAVLMQRIYKAISEVLEARRAAAESSGG
jgi:hypothetical protein